MNNEAPKDVQFINDFKKMFEEVIKQMEHNEQLQPIKERLVEKNNTIDDIAVQRESGYVKPEALSVNRNGTQLKIILGKDQNVDYRKHLMVSILADTMENDSIALKNGLASIIINNTSGYEYEDVTLIDEENIINLLSCCYGFDRMTSYIVNDDQKNFSENEQTELNKITQLADHNFEYRKKAQISNFGNIQKEIVNVFNNKENITAEELEILRLNIWNDERMFQELPCEYDNINEINDLIVEMQAKISEEEVTKVR